MDENTYKTVRSSKCECKGTGLIPPSPVPKGTIQCFCSRHRLRYKLWPRCTEGGGTELVWLDNKRGVVVDKKPRNTNERIY
jgi:hypothetical protein